ncbi:hypothetical protein B7P43_G07683 [Cryptotermes secundus]|uniref:Ribosome biogenesis protein NOP53 n=1 Tax=Cryptotermes secundus TaxID=105785 RepID=A0A2J7QZ51_9NEOP|nr:ribosome biogenesis protein NOP53 isoform X2 [Cryptotermes secundus]PNF33861.1 hypothetical protein B7P43_G07683 [Cryptotermes secundus]
MVEPHGISGVGTKKKRVSKKNKKSWRKHVNTKDVDSFLDDKRLEERLGTPFADRKDDELFQIDREPDGQQAHHFIGRAKKPLKPVKCFAILEERSAVPDPIKKRNRVRTPEERKHLLRKKIEEDRKERGILNKKQIIAHRNRATANANKTNRPKKGEFNVDLWEDTDNGIESEHDVEWLSPTTKYHILKNTGKMNKKLPDKFLTKPYGIPAVESPHPGMSYNPSYRDHQDLLQEVANKELMLIKEEKHLKRVTSKMFSRVTEDERESMRMKEMSEGLPEAEGDKTKQDVEDGSENDSECRAINPPAENRKKTLKKRRKLKEAQLREQQRNESRSEKKKISDIYRTRKANVKRYERKSHKMGWETKGY